MNNQEILEKAVTKAIKGGWKVFNTDHEPLEFNQDTHRTWSGEDVDSYITVYSNHKAWRQSDIIFNHDFARALWGGGSGYINAAPVGSPAVKPVWISPYKFHLMQMVISEDPIKYLGENM